MPRILFTATMGGLVLMAGQLAAQQPKAAAAPRAALTARAVPPRGVAPRLLPGTRPDVFSTIQGTALTSTNTFLANANVRLRDARFGQIVETQMTDQAGIFTFRTVDPGSYIVELLGQDRASVLASVVTF